MHRLDAQVKTRFEVGEAERRRDTRRVDVWEYFRQRERECNEMSVDGRRLECFEEEGSHGQRGRLLGEVYFAEDIYLQVSEKVEVIDNHVHRTEYAYFLIVDGVEYWGYERDLTHEPAVHMHTSEHKDRIEADRISFKKACELAWHEVSLRDPRDVDG
jgi:hypothetical protein